MPVPTSIPNPFYKDPLFGVALIVAPLCWLGLFIILQPALQPGWPFAAPAVFLLPVLVYPVLEEIVFRGFVQELVHKHVSDRFFGPLSIANLLTSLVFAGLHFVYHPPLWAALVFFPSLVFGFFKDRTHRLTAPIILHIFYNAGFLWLFAGPGS